MPARTDIYYTVSCAPDGSGGTGVWSTDPEQAEVKRGGKLYIVADENTGGVTVWDFDPDVIANVPPPPEPGVPTIAAGDTLKLNIKGSAPPGGPYTFMVSITNCTFHNDPPNFWVDE